MKDFSLSSGEPFDGCLLADKVFWNIEAGAGLQTENSGSPPVVIKPLVWCTQCRPTLNNRAEHSTLGQQYRVWQDDASTVLWKLVAWSPPSSKLQSKWRNTRAPLLVDALQEAEGYKALS